MPLSIKSMFEALWQSLGRSPRTAHDATQSEDEALHLFVPHGADRVLVGTLSKEQDEFVFRYGEAFQHQDAIPPIPAFPDKKQTYRSANLWPFFEVRLPPLGRPDVHEIIHARNIDERDTFRLLAELGRKSVTTPYEFELRTAS